MPVGTMFCQIVMVLVVGVGTIIITQLYVGWMEKRGFSGRNEKTSSEEDETEACYVSDISDVGDGNEKCLTKGEGNSQKTMR